MILSRLTLTATLTVLLLGPASAEQSAVSTANTSGAVKHHALSLIGEPKYPEDFTHFDFVNPDAPKGGVVRMPSIGGFDSLNPVLYRGEQTHLFSRWHIDVENAPMFAEYGLDGVLEQTAITGLPLQDWAQGPAG